jgi:HK97 gp10 family phage protein
MKWSVTYHNNRLVMLRKVLQSKEVSDRPTQVLAEYGRQYIPANWSGNYPPASQPGEEPAVRTGALHQSIRVLKRGKSHHEIHAGGGDVDYAVYLEYGTERMAPRPFMTPAANHLMKVAEKRFGDVLRIQIEKTVKGI